MRLLLKRILMIVGFLVVWAGSIFLYVSSVEGSPKESVMLIISVFCLLVFWWISRKIFRKSIDPNTITAVTTAQIIANEDFDDIPDIGGD